MPASFTHRKRPRVAPTGWKDKHLLNWKTKPCLLFYSTFLALLWKTTIITGRKFIKFEKQMRAAQRTIFLLKNCYTEIGVQLLSRYNVQTRQMWYSGDTSKLESTCRPAKQRARRRSARCPMPVSERLLGWKETAKQRHTIFYTAQKYAEQTARGYAAQRTCAVVSVSWVDKMPPRFALQTLWCSIQIVGWWEGYKHTQKVIQELTMSFHNSQQVWFTPQSATSYSKALHI